MNLRTWAAALAGLVTVFLLGWLVWGILLMDYMKAHTIEYKGLMNDVPNMVPLIIGDLAWTWLVAFIFDQWAGIRTFVGGMKGGAIIMFALVLGIDFQFKAMMNLYEGYSAMIVDIIAATVVGAVTGGVIGFVLGKMDLGPAE
jgi:hypothetical protein